MFDLVSGDLSSLMVDMEPDDIETDLSFLGKLSDPKPSTDARGFRMIEGCLVEVDEVGDMDEGWFVEVEGVET